jgi:hypothetical protein
MNLVIFLPIIVLIVALVLIFGRRHKAGHSGMGNRDDVDERPELRGAEQWKHRQEP